MITHRIRYALPTPGEWFTVTGETLTQAINDWHFDHYAGFPHERGIHYWRDIPRDPDEMFDDEGKLRPPKREVIHFTKVEIEHHGEVVSRVFYRGIYRRGGVKTRPDPTLRTIANFLGWEKPLEELLDEWPGEEDDWL